MALDKAVLPDTGQRQGRGQMCLHTVETGVGHRASQLFTRMHTCPRLTTVTPSQVRSLLCQPCKSLQDCRRPLSLSSSYRPLATVLLLCNAAMTAVVWLCAGKPTTPAPPTPELPSFVAVVLGSAGQSCTALCQGAGRRCAQEHLAALNNCNILRQYFACEAG